MVDTLQERRKLNEEIERAYIITAMCVRDIYLYNQTTRGISDIDLYESFYSAFSFLVLLTEDLPQLKEYQDQIDPARAWVNTTFNADDEKLLMGRCLSGAKVFKDYKKLLSDQGVIALPSK
jgi:hypothetical protein